VKNEGVSEIREGEATVVIPVYNQAFPLSLTLFGLTQQEPPFHRCPIVVVDDGSTEPVEAVVEAYRNELDITYVKMERGGRAKSRNKGVECVRDGLVIFCDADRIPRKSFIKAHFDMFQKAGEAVIIGQVREMYVREAHRNKSKVIENYRREKHDRIPQYCQLVYRLYDPEGSTSSKIPWVSTLSGNMSLPAATYRRLGGFDENFTEWGFEHFELGYRAYLQQIPFYYQKQAVNVHLAHPRSHSYVDFIANSHAYFYQKHQHPVIAKFLDFMLGKVNLRQLERIVNPGLPLLDDNSESSYKVRITNSADVQMERR
jgi:GT2 family glycosyltransferase